MKKLLLCLLILVLGIFIYLKLQILGSPTSDFNQTTRYNLGKYPIMRSILGMHSYGDARYDFLGGTSPITIEAVKAQNTSWDEQALTNFAQDVQTYTGRKTMLFDSETIQAGTLSQSDLATISQGSRHHLLPGQPNIFVIYAEDFTGSDQAIATTYKEFAIVLSDKRLKDVTSAFPDAYPQYLESTLLHEFGHQVGLEHNDQPGCIMNATAENPTVQEEFNGNYTPTKFCDYELNQLKDIKAKAN